MGDSRASVTIKELLKDSRLWSALAIGLWVYGEYIWFQIDFSLVAREEYIGTALIGFVCFVVFAKRADDIVKGLAVFSRVFGFIGLIVMLIVLNSI